MATNITWMDTVDNPGDVLTGIINATNGLFIVGLLVSIFFIMYITLRARGFPHGEILIYTGVFNFVIIVLAISGGWLAFYWLMFPVAFLLAGTIITVFGGN